jgi:hypothetical protein
MRQGCRKHKRNIKETGTSGYEKSKLGTLLKEGNLP